MFTKAEKDLLIQMMFDQMAVYHNQVTKFWTPAVVNEAERKIAELDALHTKINAMEVVA